MSITTELSAKVTSVVSYLASLFTALGSYVNNMDIGVLVGVVCAIFTAFVNWFYQAGKRERAARKSERDEKIAKILEENARLNQQLLLKQLQNIEEERCSHVLEDIEVEPK
ncbi:HP1 family phage holin [Shewanella sp. HL-SH8]|uniref:HP1 family phage holin n=1 Tax=Shewanella sp. HL-SH8 TaxID=3436242 RepID=UPI003EBC4882